MIEGPSNFLRSNWEQLGLSDHGSPEQYSVLLITPRFRASRHVVMLLVPRGRRDPELVLKISRLAGDCESGGREARNLRALHKYAMASQTVPRCLGHGKLHGCHFVLQSALSGKHLDPVRIRRQHSFYCSAVVDWLLKLPRNGASSSPVWVAEMHDRLGLIAGQFPEARDLAGRARAALDSLLSWPLPSVFEHSDLSHPNLLWQHTGTLGVVDWELAKPAGIPAADLFFFLTYAGLARGRYRTESHSLRLLQQLFERRSWVWPYIHTYFRQLQLPPESLAPLLVCCWTQRVARLLSTFETSYGEKDDNPSADVIRRHWAFRAWEHAVNEHHRIAQHFLHQARIDSCVCCM